MANSHIYKAFDALSGFRELLKDEEITKEKRHLLSEDDAYALNSDLSLLKKGQSVKIRYYAKDRYIEVSGKIGLLDITCKYLKIDKQIIAFKDIIKIEVSEE